MLISDWSSDVCSSDLRNRASFPIRLRFRDSSSSSVSTCVRSRCCVISGATQSSSIGDAVDRITPESMKPLAIALGDPAGIGPEIVAKAWSQRKQRRLAPFFAVGDPRSVKAVRSEEHTSELQSLMRISYAVFCLKKKKN